MDFLKLYPLKALKFSLAPLLIILLTTISIVSAQESLSFATPVNGSLEAGASQSWTFSAGSAEILSFVVQASGDLDPVLTITSSDGTTIISNDDYDYPINRNSLVEAIAIPRLGTYTATVAAFGSTSGDYTLTMLPGYGQVADSENFNGANDWQTADDSDLQTETVEGQLSLAIQGIGSLGVARNSSQAELQNYFAQARVTNVTGSLGWRVGMTIRQQNTDNYYAVFINSDGLWRFVLHTSQGGEVPLRDWTAHPAIVAGDTNFLLGVLINGSSFEVFYNGQYVGQVIDSTFSLAGQTGFIVGAGEVLDAQVSARFDDLLLTAPFETTTGGVFPQQLVGGSPQATVQELQRRQLIPTQGDMALIVNEGFSTQAVRPGVTRFPLGRGLTFSDFAFGATVDIQASSGTTGCALVFRDISDTDYMLAYLDRLGGYGLSQRVDDQFQAGIFGENTAFSAGTHDLLVIANGDILYYYIDGLHVGTLNAPISEGSTEGSIGNAVVNFDPIDTTCEFSNTWLWRWGG